MNELTNKLKAELWQKFSTKEYPAEWDGYNYGGGKLSQRFWEYFRAIEMLDLRKDSVLLDIGGGSPKTGFGFFTALLYPHIKELIIIDTSAANVREMPGNIEIIDRYADFENLKNILTTRPDITHISSISVFEHIEPPIREGIVKAVNDYFRGDAFAVTFEYHPRQGYFKHQLTETAMSDLFKIFTNFYLTEFDSSPVLSSHSYINVIEKIRPRKIYKIMPRGIKKIIEGLFDAELPLWYPVALKFEKSVL